MIATVAHPGLEGEAIACLTLLAVVFVPVGIVCRDKIRAVWRDLTKPLP